MDKLIYKLPVEFIERLKAIYPQEYVRILNSFIKQRLSTFRVNLVKTDTISLVNRLRDKNIQFQRVNWYGQGFVLLAPAKRDFQEFDLYKDGHVYFQNLSSMLAVIALKPEAGNNILDLCAAPGGKTCQIVSQTQAGARVVAVEKIKPRFFKLLANLKQQGCFESVDLKLMDGSDIWKDYSGYFDRVLVDAPCSSEANFFIPEPKTYAYWSPRKVKEAAHKQKRLIFSGIKSLKPGGQLIYSTCTFSPEENEEVINWALDKFPGEICLEEIRLDIPNIHEGLTKWSGKEYKPSLALTRRIIPNDTMEGFFLALLRKK